MKRIFSFLFVAMLAGQAWADEVNYDFSAVCSSGQTLYYKILNDTEVAVTSPNSDKSYFGYINPSGNLDIPSTVTYPETNGITYTITRISPSAFCGTDLTSVTIPGTVFKISERAFLGCENLTTVVISEGVAVIGEMAFTYCNNLTSISIPNSVIDIGYYPDMFTSDKLQLYEDDYAVYLGNSENNWIYFYCIKPNISSCIIHDGCKFIVRRNSIFNITSITIPNSIISIWSGAFANIQSVHFNSYEDGKYLGNDDNPYLVLVYGGSIINNKCKIIAKYPCILSNPVSLTIPESVTHIGDGAFTDVLCKYLTSVDMTAGVTYIGNYAFDGCDKLESVSIPNTVTFIGDGAFNGCDGLTSITIGDGVSYIGYGAFWFNSDNLTSIYTNSDADFFDSGLYFTKDNISYLLLNKNTVKISSCKASLSGEVTIPDEVTFGNTFNVKGILGNPFGNCRGLTSVNVPEENAYCCSIDGVLFSKDKKTLICYPAGKSSASYTIPDGVTSIGEDAFKNCSSLTSVTILNSVTSIGSSAFYGCSGLTSVTIPVGVTSIGDYAFENCSGLTSICYEGRSEPTYKSSSFTNVDKTIPVCVPVDYSSTSWCGFTNLYKGHDIVTDLGTATCTESGLSEGTHCTKCGKIITAQEVIPALGHNYGAPTYAWAEDGSACTATTVCQHDANHVVTENATITSEETIAPTCEVKGTTTYTAAFTDSKFSTQTKNVVDIPALQHSYGTPTYVWAEDGSTCTATTVCQHDANHVVTENATITSEETIAPTCEEMGTTTYTANFTDNNFSTQTKNVVDIPALQHSYGTPTYAWAEDGSACTATTVCLHDANHVITENANITSEVTTAATCEGMGTTTYTAKFNDSKFPKQTKGVVDIPALGHDYGEATYVWAEDGSTCTATTVCQHDANHVVTENATITSEETIAPTCEVKGTTTYTAAFTDSKFSTQTKNVVDIPALQHSYGTPTYVWAEDGSTCTATTVCQHDANHVVTENATITSEETIAPTCEEMGTTTYTANFTDNNFSTQTKNVVDIPALQHSYGTPTYAWAEDGSACTATTVCLHDANHVVTENATITSEETIAPTCEEMGTTTYTANFTDSKFTTQTKAVMDILANGHTDGEAVFENVVAATCSAAGSRDSVVFCTVCQAEVSRTKKEIAKLAHTEVTDAAKVPTCTETGLTEGKHCSVCNTVLVAQQNVEALGHTEVVDAAVAPTCTEAGKTEGKHCSVCNAVLVAQQNVEALGHKEVVDVAVAATCTGTGKTEGKHCSVCNTVLVAQQNVEALGHKEVVDAAVAATCTEAGKTEGKHCSVCEAVLVAQEVIPAKGHSYGSAITSPTCTEVGFTTHTCSVCNHSYNSDTVPANGHTEVVDAAVAATCTEAGKTEGKHCSVCETVILAQEAIPALGHMFENYIFNNDATTEADGTETAVCEHGCGATDTRVAEGTKLPKDNTTVADDATNAVCIYAHHNIIVIENADAEIRVYNAMGALVATSNDTNAEIRINVSGVYVVRVCNTAKRVMIID